MGEGVEVFIVASSIFVSVRTDVYRIHNVNNYKLSQRAGNYYIIIAQLLPSGDVTKSILDFTRRHTYVQHDCDSHASDDNVKGSCSCTDYSSCRGVGMSSRDEKVCMELAFVRENGVSKQEKAKAFWKFLDAQSDLLPHKGISR